MVNWIIMLSAPLLVISSLPQMIRLLKRKSSGDISLITYILTGIGITLLLIKSILVNELSLIIPNACSLFMLIINLTLIIKYKWKN